MEPRSRTYPVEKSKTNPGDKLGASRNSRITIKEKQNENPVVPPRNQTPTINTHSRRQDAGEIEPCGPTINTIATPIVREINSKRRTIWEEGELKWLGKQERVTWCGCVEEGGGGGFRSGAATLVELIDARGLRASAEKPTNKRKGWMPVPSRVHFKRKRGRPAGSQSAQNKMEKKMALVKQRLALLDSSSSNSSSCCCESDKDGDYMPVDDELGVLVAHQPQPIAIHYADKEYKDEVSDVSRQKISASVPSNCGSAMDRAKEVQAKIPTQHPSFVKEMLKSHVVLGFWLGLPVKFCNKHLPMDDTIIVLEDENGDNHDTTYLAAKQGLSAGWRGFAIKHSIKVGDVVVFELVGVGSGKGPLKFKIYIVRANEFTTAGAVSLLNLEVCKKGKLLKEECAGELKSEEDSKVNTVYGDIPWIDANGIVSEAIDGIRMLDSDIGFEDVTSFSNFNIIVDRLVIDCKFHDHLRRTYYELCCSQKAFLHKHLLKQLNLTLVVGVILETVNIAEGIRACKAEASSSCGEDLLIWKKTLESFELLGMDVAFLLKRVNALLGLEARSRTLSECQKFKELRFERAHAADRVKALELRLSGVKGVLQKIDADMKEMESSVKKGGVSLQQLATAPW